MYSLEVSFFHARMLKVEQRQLLVLARESVSNGVAMGVVYSDNPV